jgi:hypothetical protein
MERTGIEPVTSGLQIPDFKARLGQVRSVNAMLCWLREVEIGYSGTRFGTRFWSLRRTFSSVVGRQDARAGECLRARAALVLDRAPARWSSACYLAEARPGKLCLARSRERLLAPDDASDAAVVDGVSRPDEGPRVGRSRAMSASARSRSGLPRAPRLRPQDPTILQPPCMRLPTAGVDCLSHERFRAVGCCCWRKRCGTRSADHRLARDAAPTT